MEKNKGFISFIILLIVALGLLKYFFDWSIFEFLGSERGRATLSYLKDVVVTAWSYLSAPVTFVWEKIMWPILQLSWQSFQSLLEFGKNTNSTT